jgi:hypothetical protein
MVMNVGVVSRQEKMADKDINKSKKLNAISLVCTEIQKTKNAVVS